MFKRISSLRRSKKKNEFNSKIANHQELKAENQHVPLNCDCGYSFKNELVWKIREHLKICENKENVNKIDQNVNKNGQNVNKIEFENKTQNQENICQVQNCPNENQENVNNICLQVNKNVNKVVYNVICAYCNFEIENTELRNHIEKKHFILRYFMSKLYLFEAQGDFDSETEEFPTVSTDFSILTNDSYILKNLSLSQK